MVSADINEKLWSRKKLKARRQKNENKKLRKAYFSSQKEDQDVAVTDK